MRGEDRKNPSALESASLMSGNRLIAEIKHKEGNASIAIKVKHQSLVLTPKGTACENVLQGEVTSQELPQVYLKLLSSRTTSIGHCWF